MSFTDFPHGITSFGVPLLGGNPGPITGSVFFVDSLTGLNSNAGGSPSTAFATLDWAIGKCTANKGDVIYLMPNHAETVTGIGGVTADIAGISIIGLGNFNQRPRLLMDGGTTVTFAVSAADVTIENIVMASGHLLVATGFDVTGKGCWIDQVEFADNTTAENWGSPVKATGAVNTADGLKVTNCRWVPLVATVNSLEFVEITDDIDGLVVTGNVIICEGTATPLILQAGTKVMTNIFVVWNFLSHKMTAGALFMSNGGTGNSGIVAHNRFGHADVTTTHDWGAVTGLRLFDNLSTSVDNLSGVILPAADVNS